MPLNFQDSPSVSISRILAIVFLVVSIVLMTVYAAEGPTGSLHTLQAQMRLITSPFETAGTAGGALVENGKEAASDAAADETTLSALRDRNRELTETLTQAEEYRQEAIRLQELLGMKDTYDIDGIAGRVIGRSTDAWSQTLTLDIGSSDGVDAGLTVVGNGGVIGQVISTTSATCDVRLITDPSSGVSCMVQSSRAEGIVRGSLSGLLYLEDIDSGVEVSVGDVVETSGLGGSYTKGLLIGTVVRVDGNPTDESRKIIVSQNGTTGAMEEVLVVFSAKSDSTSNSKENSDDTSSPSGNEG